MSCCVVVQVEVPQGPVYCSERVAEYHRLEWLRGGPRTLKHLLLHGALATEKTEREKEEERLWLGLFPTPPGGLHAVRPPTGWPHIQIPGQGAEDSKLRHLHVYCRVTAHYNYAYVRACMRVCMRVWCTCTVFPPAL